MEETGFEAADLQFLTRASPTAGLTSEVMSYFVARGLRRVADGGGVEDERIVTHLVPVNQVRSWLTEQSATDDGGRNGLQRVVFDRPIACLPKRAFSLP